ncbi:MAG: N-acetylmuramoyl-L-alanine amidase [Moorellales bacterium]
MPQFKVVLDPGHGGKDPGAVGPGGTKEKDVALAVAKLLAKELSYFARPILTREHDEFRELWERSSLANTVGADLFVSVHCNAAEDKTANGTETIVYRFGGMAERLARKVQAQLVATLRTCDRGVKEKNLHVCRETRMPAILVELAFISNVDEEKKLASPDWQKAAARAIARGVADYLGVSLREGQAEEAESMFQDTKGHWAEKDIAEAAELGLVAQAEKFRPNDPLSRAEAVVLLMRLYRILTKREAKNHV